MQLITKNYLIKESAIKLQHDVVAVLWKAFRNSPLRQVRMEKYPWKQQLKLVSDDDDR